MVEMVQPLLEGKNMLQQVVQMEEMEEKVEMYTSPLTQMQIHLLILDIIKGIKRKMVKMGEALIVMGKAEKIYI